MDFKDYYQSLGVAKTATDDEIRKAYRKLARKYHPDVSKEADAQDRMREINEAYEVLKDKEKRAEYDVMADRVARGGSPRGDFRSGDFRSQGDWGAHEFHTSGADEADFSDFFSSMFGQQAQRAQRQARPQNERGEDQHASIEISFREAFDGATKHLSLRALERDSQQQAQWVTRTLEVKIPKGVRPGQMIRLAGRGLPGTGTGAPGDLFLEVQLAPDPVYRAEGLDIYMQTPVTPSEAALGAQIEVPTPAGSTVEVAVPANSRAGMKLRLKGRGFKTSSEQGNLYLVLDIALPPVNDATRAAYESLAKAAAGFNPRQHLGA